MARDRKRAKQRKERQARSGVARRAQDGAVSPNGRENGNELHEHEAPELASGEVDLSEAQLALGRPELVDAAPAPPDAVADAEQLGELADEAEFEQLEDRVDDAEERYEEAREGDVEEERDLDGQVVQRTRRRRAPAERREGSRLANFLRGSWRELERVQWPDRRQVAQATAVVIGFVIVAGAFLGLMDLLAGKVVDFII